MAIIGKHIRPNKEPEASPNKFSVADLPVFACICIVCVLLEGIYLIVSAPAIRIVLLVAMGCLVVAALAVWVYLIGNREDAPDRFALRVFPILLLVLGLTNLFFFAPNNVPDEEVHYREVYEYANLLDPTMGPTDMRTEDYDFVNDSELYAREINGSFWYRQKQGIPLTATKTGITAKETGLTPVDVRANLPQTRIVAALGVLLGRVFGLSGTATFYLGRLFNFLFSFAFIVIAVRLMPIGRTILMTISLLPMTLHLLASYSYDAEVIGFAFLLIALLLRVICLDERPSRGVLVASVVVATLLTPCKLVYVFLCFVALLAPKERFSSKREMFTWKAAMLAAPLLVLVLLRLSMLAKVSGIGEDPNATTSRLGEQGVMVSVSSILSNPLHSILVFFRTLYQEGPDYLFTLVGGRLGWLQINTAGNETQSLVLFATLGISMLPSVGDRACIPRRVRWWFVVLFVATFVAILASMYLGWTFVTEDTIMGVQGRYFLPVLPLLLLAMRNDAIVARIHTMPYIAMAIGGLECLYLAQIAFIALTPVA